MRRIVLLSLRAIGFWILTGTVMNSRLIAENEPSFFSDSPVAATSEAPNLPDNAIGILFGRQDESPRPVDVAPHAPSGELNHQETWADSYSRPEAVSNEEFGYQASAYGERESALSAADGNEKSSEVPSVFTPASQVDGWQFGATALAVPSPASDEMGQLFDSTGRLVGIVKRVTIEDSVGLLVVDTAGNPQYLNLPSGDDDNKVYRRFKVTGANYTIDKKYEGTTIERQENSDVLDRRVFEFVGEGFVPTKSMTFVPTKSKAGPETTQPADVDYSDTPTTPLSFVIDPALSQRVGTNP